MAPPTKEEIDAELDEWLGAYDSSARKRELESFKREVQSILAEELTAFRESLRQEIKTELRLNLNTLHKQTQAVLRSAAESAANATKRYVEQLCSLQRIDED
jgi:hypothetical protein